MSSLIFRFLLSFILVVQIFTAHARESRWRDGVFEYVANGKSLKDMLRDFGASQGYLVVVSNDVEGVVSGRFSLKPDSLMEILSSTYGFIWHTEGNSIFVSPASNLKSDIIRLTEFEFNQLKISLARLNISAATTPITFDKITNTGVVSGPSRYVELVLKVIQSISNEKLNSKDDVLQFGTPVRNTEVRIFPLRYAWAADRRFKVGGKEQNIAGVATVLQDLYRNDLSINQGAAGGVPNGRANTSLGRFRAASDQGLRLSPEEKSQLNLSIDKSDFLEATTVKSTRSDLDFGVPKFRADSRMNAIIVRDFSDRMLVHEATISAMDVKPGMVEIEARIIEINSQEAESLGIDWRIRSNAIDVQFGRENLPILSWGTALVDTAPSSGGILTTVLGDSGRFLISRVRALAEVGRANLLSSPKILTLDNVEAVMDDLNTFFVRVSGNLDVNLFDVSVGTSLHVTPLIINEDEDEDGKKIKLVVRIEDGSLSSQQIDQIPIVRRSTIITQSIVPDGQSLLIAGYSYQSDVSNGSGIPALSSIPYFGRLFKNSSDSIRRVDRFFLITPKIVP